MKAIISSTYDDKYLWFIPIVTWCWNKLGVDVICFMPRTENISPQMMLINKVQVEQGIRQKHYFFNAPEHKEATYAQCSRLYAACLDLPEDEILVTGDVDMIPFYELKRVIDSANEQWGGMMNIYGVDLVPESQFPMCYAWGSMKEWRRCYQYAYGGGYNDVSYKTYQEYLDLLLGDLESEHFRGNHWSKDQEELKNLLSRVGKIEHNRARLNTQFARNRVDRDDINWRSYVNEELIDAHLWRDGFAEGNFENIMGLLQMKYPQDDFTWLKNYNEAYKKLL